MQIQFVAGRDRIDAEHLPMLDGALVYPRRDRFWRSDLFDLDLEVAGGTAVFLDQIDAVRDGDDARHERRGWNDAQRGRSTQSLSIHSHVHWHESGPNALRQPRVDLLDSVRAS